MDLGSDPGRFVHYPGGSGFYFSPELEETLQKEAMQYSPDDLEDVFFPFLKPEARRLVKNFRRRGRSSRWRDYPPEKLLELQNGLHSFDKRRLHFLRCGRVDIGVLHGRPWKFLNVLLHKSRDEIEHTLESMELQLRPHEYRSYVYTALHLQRHFAGQFTKNTPAALDAEKVDEAFVFELCRLNRDAEFFKGVEPGNDVGLSPYLMKYAILYFDHEFERPSVWAEFAGEFERRRHFPPAGGKTPGMATDEACKCLGICPSEFSKMNREELIRCYRRRAKRMHPDGGGEHDEFIRMTQAYESLLAKK